MWVHLHFDVRPMPPNDERDALELVRDTAPLFRAFLSNYQVHGYRYNCLFFAVTFLFCFSLSLLPIHSDLICVSIVNVLVFIGNILLSICTRQRRRLNQICFFQKNRCFSKREKCSIGQSLARVLFIFPCVPCCDSARFGILFDFSYNKRRQFFVLTLFHHSLFCSILNDSKSRAHQSQHNAINPAFTVYRSSEYCFDQCATKKIQNIRGYPKEIEHRK